MTEKNNNKKEAKMLNYALKSTSKRNQMLRATRATLKESSVHGVKKIVQAKFKSIRLIWVLCLLASVGVCAWNILDIVTKYYQREVVCRMNVKQEAKLSFPFVYICDRGEFKKINDRILRARFDLKELNLDQEFQKIPIGNWNCFRFNSAHNLKYVEDKPTLAVLEIEIFIDSDLTIKGSQFN